MRKKRRLRFRKEFIATVIGLLAIILVLVIITIKNNSYKSINENALRIKEKNCIIFYPDSSFGKDYAKDICKNNEFEEKTIIDYQIEEKGDYYHIIYDNYGTYYLDRDYKELSFNGINEEGKHIISDYMRFVAKKDYPEVYYNSEFLNNTFYENIDLNSLKYDIKSENLLVKSDEYNMEFEIPLKYLQIPLNMNFGYDNDDYIKPKFIDPNKPMVALTFDDGPYSPIGQIIIDALYKYDGNATFFVIGNRLSERQLEFMKESISKGNEYGSHTSDHQNLFNLSIDGGVYAVKDCADYVENHIGYKMKVYRSPYGNHVDGVSQGLGMVDVLWNVDSLDWSNHSVSQIKQNIMDKTDNYSIILMHEIVEETGQAIEDVVKYLVDNGYQLVTASELMEVLDINPNNTYAFYGK